MHDLGRRQDRTADEQSLPMQEHEPVTQPALRLAQSVVAAEVARRQTSGDEAAENAEARAGLAAPVIDLPHRAAMERRFGRDFASVRAHIDPAATASLGARAYTLGYDIVFATREPDEELVAHELAHVAQQSEGRVGSVASDEAEAQSVAAGATPAVTDKQGGIDAQVRKDAILTPAKIKDAITFNNHQWKDPHRTEILKSLRADVSDATFTEPDVVAIATKQHAEGVAAADIDGKIGPATMAALLREGLKLSEEKVRADQVKLVFFPGEYEDIAAWKKVREDAIAANGGKPLGDAEFRTVGANAPAGHGTIYVFVDGNVVESIQARGGPPFTMKDGADHTADPSKAGTYKLGEGKSVVTSSWAFSQIAWGAPIQEKDGEIQFKNPGEGWQFATGPKSKLAQPLDRNDFLNADGSVVKEWRKNDFGETGFRIQGSPGLYVHTGPDTEESLKEEEEHHKVHKPLELEHSHGCVHVEPIDRKRLMHTGYLQAGVTFVIKKYTESLDPKSINRK